MGVIRLDVDSVPATVLCCVVLRLLSVGWWLFGGHLGALTIAAYLTHALDGASHGGDQRDVSHASHVAPESTPFMPWWLVGDVIDFSSAVLSAVRCL